MYKYLIFILLISCTKKTFSTPESVLKEYIKYAFDHKDVQVKDLHPFLTDPLLDLYRTMSPEEFKKVLGHDHRNYRLKILLKKCQEDNNCYLTFVLSYENFENNKKKYSLEVRKVANILKEEDGWKIASVDTLKTHIDSMPQIDVK